MIVREAPVIETQRLRLRPHRLEDFEDCFAMWSDPLVTRYIGGRPSTPEEVWGRILRYCGHWTLLHYGYWAVEEKTSGRFVGELGFADYLREIEPSLRGIPEIGWALAPWCHGKGYATEGVLAAVAWADAHLNAERTACLIAPENTPSIRVAQKCGYHEWQATEYKGQPTLLFERHRP